MTSPILRPLALLLVAGLAASGCGPQKETAAQDVEGSGDPAATLVERAERFRTLLNAERYDEARVMMSEDPRRWFAPREGPGQPWEIGPGAGPWSAWDEHFRSRSEVVSWREEPLAAVALVRETNDYFRLLERGHVTNEITYYFDERGRIGGLLIDAVGERPPGRTDAFLAWARTHDPDELDALMPDGEIDPSGDHPRRFRALLNRWRSEAGLDPIGGAPRP